LHQGVFLSFHSSRFLPLEGNSTPLPSQITTVEELSVMATMTRALAISGLVVAATWGQFMTSSPTNMTRASVTSAKK